MFRGVLLGLTRTHGRSVQLHGCAERGSRVYDFKPYYRGATIQCNRGNKLKDTLRREQHPNTVNYKKLNPRNGKVRGVWVTRLVTTKTTLI